MKPSFVGILEHKDNIKDSNNILEAILINLLCLSMHIKINPI